MRILRTLLVAASAAALGSALTISAASITSSAASTPHRSGAPAYSAKFLAEARAALVRDLRISEPALWVHGAPRPNNAISSTTAIGSYNWAGYADGATTSGTFTAASGAWSVPKVTCTTEDRITSDWVGLDGLTDGTVEQLGTTSQCFKGVAVYYSWYEMYPAGTVEVGTTVAAADAITASVTRSGTTYTLKLTDATHTANSFTQTATCALTTCTDTSAEWIAERPSYGTTGIVPEALFGAIKFSSASVTANGKTTSISGYAGTNYNIECVDSTDTYAIVTTSALNTAGNLFTSTWKNSY